MKNRVEKEIKALEAEQERLRLQYALNHVQLDALRRVLEPKKEAKKKAE